MKPPHRLLLTLALLLWLAVGLLAAVLPDYAVERFSLARWPVPAALAWLASLPPALVLGLTAAGVMALTCKEVRLPAGVARRVNAAVAVAAAVLLLALLLGMVRPMLQAPQLDRLSLDPQPVPGWTGPR